MSTRIEMLQADNGKAAIRINGEVVYLKIGDNIVVMDDGNVVLNRHTSVIVKLSEAANYE